MTDPQIIGEYEITVDTKGRIMLPALLRKQLPENSQDKLIVNRGFEKHIYIYPVSEWEKIAAELNKLNQYVKDNRELVRYILRGATPVPVDATGRMLIPKSLLDYSTIQRDAVLLGNINKIEMWSKSEYDKIYADDTDDISKLAEKVMGNRYGGGFSLS
ncbi:MAG: division/cell wall cluster transcriptional repressor MraZ [Bacteroidota bacterium]|jgi:MraZ protein